MDQLPALAKVFSYLSLLTIGGGMAAYPELQTLTVTVHHWLTTDQLTHIYSVGQMAPGPNMMMVAAVGDQVSGIPGAFVAALAFFVPTGFLTFGVGRLWTKLEHWPWRASIQKGLAPVAIGLAVAGTISFGKTAVTNWITVIVALAIFGLTLRTKINPALLILGGAVVGGALLR